MNMHVKAKRRLTVGDRVEHIDRGDKPFGRFGKIIEDDGTSVPYLVAFDGLSDGNGRDGNEWWCFESQVAPAPTYSSCAAAEVDNLADEYGAPKAKFKVGDRVRRTTGSFNRMDKGDEATITAIDERTGALAFDGYLDGHEPSYFEHVAVAPATATTTSALRIEAGKFYKTRDGRRVGPMREWCDERDLFTALGTGGLWDINGGPHYKFAETTDSPTLIAEWTDEPKMETLGDILAAALRKPTTIAKHSQTGTAIVAVLENGTPRPATRPFVHTSTGAAETEANRLARTNPGKEFGVYTLGTVAKVERVYEHEWQRLAANGETAEARKVLQRTGLTSLQASRVVQEFVAAA